MHNGKTKRREKGTEEIFKTMTKNFPILMSDTTPTDPESSENTKQDKHKTKHPTPRHLISKDKEKKS